jgi:hypothetical protein
MPFVNIHFQAMKESELYNSENNHRNSFGYNYLILAVVSLAALAATFLAADSSLDYEIKTKIFAAIICFIRPSFSSFICGRNIEPKKSKEKLQKTFLTRKVEGKLLALEEAGEFFGASLKSADMFRLVASRINELIPFTTCALFLADNDGGG